jgi:superfamily II DNA helicase RecQ
VSPSVNFLAMTATAEERTRETILLTLNMQRPVVIKRSADRANIFYGIGKATSLKKLSGILVAGLKRYRNSYPKTIVFCRT